jgi:hypothetical protein
MIPANEDYISSHLGVKSALEEKYQKRLKEVEADALTMALRLMGEDEATFSPECAEVMERWRKECFKAIKEAAQ